MFCVWFLPVYSIMAEEIPVDDLPRKEIMRLGERMYINGILPSGRPMEAFIRGDVEVDSTAFSCASCHLRAGLGSVEGGVVTPPTNGTKLYKPYQRPPSMNDIVDRAGRYIYAKTVQKRPAYTRESLIKALHFGVDPAGQVFNDVMPRYPLADRDMAIMVRYLEYLSSESSPGASPEGFAFATIVSEDVSNDDAEAMLFPLRKFIDMTQEQVGIYADFLKFGYIPTVDMKFAFRNATLDVWRLKGKPDTWREQLDKYYSSRPVFAVLGGISNQDWQPVHDFCEDQRLPCLFPITDYPVVSGKGWYTYYFNKGYYQEGGATAHFISRMGGFSENSRILQVSQDSAPGKRLAEGFSSEWGDLGHKPVNTIQLNGINLEEMAALAKTLEEQQPDILLLWMDERIAKSLAAIVKTMKVDGKIFVSSGYLGSETTNIPESVRDRVYISYPYRLKPFVGTKDGPASKNPVYTTHKDFGNKRITSRTVTMLKQSTMQGLRLIYDNLYRDHLFDVMSMQMDQVVPDYERISFGPGQRFVSKGCYIIQLGKGEEPELIPKSEWVIQ